MSTAPHGSQYQAGDRVQVLQPSPRDGELVPWYPGTVVDYWRNDCFHVREDAHGTVAAYHLRYLAPIS